MKKELVKKKDDNEMRTLAKEEDRRKWELGMKDPTSEAGSADRDWRVQMRAAASSRGSSKGMRSPGASSSHPTVPDPHESFCCSLQQQTIPIFSFFLDER